MADETDSSGGRWRKEEARKRWIRIIRRGVAILLLLFSPLLGFLWPFVALLGCILIAPDIAGYLSRFAGNLIWLRREGELKPQYGIAESLVARGKYAEAEEEYEKIIIEFPNEVKPHADMINIAVRWLNDGPLAEGLYQRGLSLLKNQADRDRLTELYKAISSRLKSSGAGNNTAIPFEDFQKIRDRVARDRKKLWR